MATTSSDTTLADLSAGVLDFQDRRILTISPTSISSPHATMSTAPSPFAKLDAAVGIADSLEMGGTSSASADMEPDAQILEALRSKDRIYVLKLGEQMEALIKDRRMKVDLAPSTSYQRLLVHRCSAYYKLTPETDPVTKNIIVYYRSESRIPIRRICELVPAEESAQPAIQIMRRPRGRQYSQPGSTAGEDADTSDVDASEAGSISGRSNQASAAAKRFKTIEEREAAYNEARSRIFMGFEEKEKEKDMSANSSTFSLVSGSASTSGGRGSSIGDLDDSASSAPTESEWSGPAARDKSRKGASSTTSSRSLRSSGPSFNGSGSSRNSRATSPSFTYPSYFDPATVPSYDQSPYGSHPPPPTGYVSPYGYPAYTPPSGQPYGNPYYYPSYAYPPPPSHHSDPVTPAGVEPVYLPPNAPQQPAYNPAYMWPTPPPTGQHPVSHQHLQHGQPGVLPGHHDTHAPAHSLQPMQNIPQYPPYAPSPPVYGYGMPAYYAQPYQTGPPMGPPPMSGPMYQPSPIAEPMSVNNPNGADFNRASSRSSNGNGSMNGKRGGPRVRSAWTYGPGVSAGGYTYSPSGSMNGGGGNEAHGPRLSSNMRRTSSSSGSAGARTPADETASTASSSTTSSSSRRTFTSTSTSSKHPLPARPDWAVGLKPQHPRHHDHHGSANARTISPARMGQPHLPQHHQPQPELQSNDFPPLTSAPSPRQPVVGGAWTNASMSRVMMPGPQGTAPQGTALVHYPTSQQSSPQIPTSGARFEEQDQSFERPSPRTPEFFSSPGALGRVPTNGEGGGDVAALSDSLGAMGLGSSRHSSDGIAFEERHIPAAAEGDVGVALS
ncbi:hypothetical protein C2E23DRAFT_807666 [Lenzites betulinus]|nr:hypothetical protein C2E23DRAFT_807666 [Lenzites betulinus]